jgi:predicted phage terminase large subunit-like protein
MSWTDFSRRFRRDSASTATESNDERLEAFIRRVNPRFKFYYHNRLMIEALESAYRGEIEWLMIWVPPGTGKSEVVSRLGAAYHVYTNPRERVFITSYGAALAQGLSRDARDYFTEAGGQLSPAQRAKTQWKSLQGGGISGAGFGGAVRGMRYHIGVTDDPHKGIDDIDSDLKRERLYRWWDNTWLNRAELNTDRKVVRIIVMQRLADNDLCGWLLSRPDADKWTILALDAIHSDEPFLPANCDARLIPDHRQVGELLAPEILGHDKLREVMVDSDTADAQYQQRPRARKGKIIDPAWFRRIDPIYVPLMMARVVGVDLAISTKTSADFTVAVCVGYGVDGHYYIFRPYREKRESPDLRRDIPLYARQHYASQVAVESVAYQLSFVQELRADPTMMGIAVIEADADRDKESRARTWSPIAEQELVYLVDDGSGWADVFLDECRDFPRGRHDDQIDAVGNAFTALRGLKGGGGLQTAVG